MEARRDAFRRRCCGRGGGGHTHARAPLKAMGFKVEVSVPPTLLPPIEKMLCLALKAICEPSKIACLNKSPDIASRLRANGSVSTGRPPSVTLENGAERA
jgi:hypothetical protein